MKSLSAKSSKKPFFVHSVGDLLKINEQLTTEKDKLLSEVVTLREKLVKDADTEQETEAAKEKLQETVSQVETPR